MLKGPWAYFEDALKLILAGSTSEPLSVEQRGIFVNMLSRGIHSDTGDRPEKKRLPDVRTQMYCLDEEKDEYETMYYIPDLFRYMVTAFDDCDTSAPPVDLPYLKRMLKETEENADLTILLRKIEIQREIAEWDRTRHGGNSLKLEAKQHGRARLNAELAKLVEKIEAEKVAASTRTAERNKKLQDAANALAAQWRRNNRVVFTKREIAEELAKSDEWKDMTAGRIERILVIQW